MLSRNRYLFAVTAVVVAIAMIGFAPRMSFASAGPASCHTRSSSLSGSHQFTNDSRDERGGNAIDQATRVSHFGGSELIILITAARPSPAARPAPLNRRIFKRRLKLGSSRAAGDDPLA